MDKGEALMLDRQLCFPLYAASRLVTQLYNPLLKELGITYPQYLVLLVLWEKDGQPVSAIGRRLYLESNTLTPLLKRLEEKGMVVRKRSEEDERVVAVALTEKGRALKAKAVCIPEQIIGALSAGEEAGEEVVQFQATLYKIIQRLST